MNYLLYIKLALEKLYQNDISLFDGKTHEQTFSFRIAFYLGQELENIHNGLFVDCEYHRDIVRNDGRKYVECYGYFRPDIIFHNRGHDNRFCIEVKKHSFGTDKRKVEAMISEYNYKEGYCIYNLTERGVTIWYKNILYEEKKSIFGQDNI